MLAVLAALPLVPALTVSLAAAAAPQQPATAPPAELSPVQILLKMSRTYAACRSYRDTGKVRSRTVMEEGRLGSDVPFTTAFVREQAFRFEFTSGGLGESAARCLLWWNGEEVRSWWDARPGVRYAESLQQALDAASGISLGASLRVPGMLLPALVGSGAPLVAPERGDDDLVGGAQCFRVTGKTRATPYVTRDGAATVTVTDETVTLWVDRATFLLRKVEEARTFTTYRTTTTTTYEPALDVAIPPEQLAFDAPPPTPGAAPAPGR